MIKRYFKKIADKIYYSITLRYEIFADLILTRAKRNNCTLEKTIKNDPKIGIVILVHNRPEYLKPCLDSLFETKLYNYDVTFLIQDDGSTDSAVQEIINRKYDPKYKIVRVSDDKSSNSWGGAFNKAMKRLLKLDSFDIVGSCDSDAYFNPEWLDKMIKIALWAKQNHRNNCLGPFSSFNSSDSYFHRIMGRFVSPFGRYVVKERMGALNYFYFTDDFHKLGFFPENKNDETIMTEKLKKIRVRNFCTETSHIEHIGQYSVLNKWRQKPVDKAVFGLNLTPGPWLGKLKEYKFENLHFDEVKSPKVNRLIILLNKARYKAGFLLGVAKTRGYQKLKDIHSSSGVDVNLDIKDVIPSEMKIDIIIPAIGKDLIVLPLVVASARKYILHPIGRIKIISPESKQIREFCKDNDCDFIDENVVAPLVKEGIGYVVGGKNRSGWLFQQIVKLAAETISNEDNFLILDADTVFIRPQVFETEGKIIFDISDEYNPSYFKPMEELLGFKSDLPFSFVSHHALMNRRFLTEFKKEIEKRIQLPWYNAILECTDFSVASGFSEYETYGNLYFHKAKDKMVLEYWHNLSLSRRDISKIVELTKKYSRKYKTISFHDYK